MKKFMIKNVLYNTFINKNGITISRKDLSSCINDEYTGYTPYMNSGEFYFDSEEEAEQQIEKEKGYCSQTFQIIPVYVV